VGDDGQQRDRRHNQSNAPDGKRLRCSYHRENFSRTSHGVSRTFLQHGKQQQASCYQYTRGFVGSYEI
jgi:hypothetical protein